DVSGPSESHGQLPCAICQQAIGVDAEGREFVPCECAYRICRPCYEYIRAHEGNRCPQCLSKYRRLAGSPPVDDDPPEEVIRHLEESIPDAPAPSAPAPGPPAIAAPVPPIPVPSALPAPHTLPSSPLPPSSVPLASPLSSSAPHLALEASSSSPSSASHASASPPAPVPVAAGSSSGAGGQGNAVSSGGGGAGLGIGVGGGGDESPSSGSAGSPSSYGYGSIVWFTPRRQLSALAPNGDAASAAGVSAASVAGAAAGAAAAGAAGLAEGGPSTAIIPVHDTATSAGGLGGGDGGLSVMPNDGASADGSPFIVDDTRRPLSRKVPVPSSMLNPYRFAVVVRFVVMILFFKFRVTNPNNSAFLLWLASVVCEIWFGISWIFDQLPKWSPITRETFLNRLSLRYEQEGRPCELPQVDVFVSTADPFKEPPLVTANVILSVLAADYPVDKVACYLSDDGASMLTFEALMETANFSRLWVPFCRKHAIEPRAPEMYFAGGVDYLLGKVNADFVKERRRMKREYDEFKVRMNALVVKAQDSPRDGWTMPDGTAWPGNDRCDHVGMIQVFLQPNGETKDVNGDPLPYLVYVSREKRPNYDHNKKAGAMNAMMRASALLTNAPFILNLDCDHYVNNSAAIREAICFLADPLKGGRVCFVQFPQRFDGVDKSDRYANHNTVFYDVNMKGLDGQQGPMYVGTGCVFRRQALYGFDPPPKTPTKRRTCCSLCPSWLSGRPSPVRLPSHLSAGRAAAGGTQQGGLGEEGAGAFTYGGRVKRRWFGGRGGRRGEGEQEGLSMGGMEEGRGGRMGEHGGEGSGGERGWEEGEEAALLPTRWHVKRFGLCHNFIMTVFDGVGGAMVRTIPSSQGVTMSGYTSALLHPFYPDFLVPFFPDFLVPFFPDFLVPFFLCAHQHDGPVGAGAAVGNRVGGDLLLTAQPRVGRLLLPPQTHPAHRVSLPSPSMPLTPAPLAFFSSFPLLSDRVTPPLLPVATSSRLSYLCTIIAHLSPSLVTCLRSNMPPPPLPSPLFLRRSYMNTALYPFTSIALTVYCFLPAISLFSGQFIVPNVSAPLVLACHTRSVLSHLLQPVLCASFCTSPSSLLPVRPCSPLLMHEPRSGRQQIDNWAVLYFLALFLSIFATALLEIRWSGVSLEEWWRNEQFWVIGGTSAHFAAVMQIAKLFQGLLKVVAGVEVHFTLTSKASQDMEDELAELYTVRWTWLFLIPLTIIIVNAFAILAGVAHAINNWQSTDSSISGYGHPIKAPTSNADQIGQLVGQVFFSVWVLLHLYPFTKYNVQETMQLLQESASLVNRAAHLLHADASPLAPSFWLRPVAVAADSPAGKDARAGEARGGRKYYVNLVQTARALQNAVVLLRQKQRRLVMGQINNAMAAIDGVKVVLVPREDRQVLEHLNVARRFAEHAKLSFMGQEQRD
ncbi:unnamed protein product, partial [Closterium sp. NIES-53]